MKKSTWISVGSALGVAFLATGSTATFAAENEYTDLNFPVEIEGQKLSVNISLKNEFHSYPDFVKVRYEVIDGEPYGFYWLPNETSLASEPGSWVSMGSNIGNLEVTFASDCKQASTSIAEFDLYVMCQSALLTDQIGDVTPKTFTYSLQENPDIDHLECYLESYRGAHVGRLLNASEDHPNSEYLRVGCTIRSDLEKNEYVFFDASNSLVMHYGEENRLSTINVTVDDFPPYPLHNIYYNDSYSEYRYDNTYVIDARFEQPGSNKDNWTDAEWEAYMEEVMESAEMLRGTMPDSNRIYDDIVE